MANRLLSALFLLFITTTTAVATAVNSTISSTDPTVTAAVNSGKSTSADINLTKPTTSADNSTTSTVNSTQPTTTSAVNSTKSTTPTVNSAKPMTATVVNDRNPTTVAGAANTISPGELDTLLEVLRYRGYPLFSNAISTSDVQFQLLSGATVTVAADSPSVESTSFFTIFAPKDHFLYALDMAADADAYVAALRCHVIPSRRLTISQLRNNLTTPYLDTLLPHYSVLVGKSRTNDYIVTVDGVRISDPDLYVGSGFAVHGLDGILLTGFNMYEDSLGLMGKGFFAPVNQSGRSYAAATPRKPLPTAKRIGGFSRMVRKQRKLQYRRVSRKDDF